MSRATKTQTEARVNDLLRIILDGAEPGWDLCEFVREQERTEGSHWYVADGEKPLSYSQIRRYAEKAEERIVKSSRTSRKRQLKIHLAKRRNLYAKSLSQGNVGTALACLDSEAKLLGLWPAAKVEATGKGGAPLYPPLDAMVAAICRHETSGDSPDENHDAGSSAGD